MAMNGISEVQERSGEPSLGRLLRERRHELGLTQQDVATAAGLSIGFISQVEHGHTAPSLSSLVAISGALKTRVSRFLPQQPRGGSTFTRQSEREARGLELGAIRYEITAFPLLLYTCNCTDCQTASGSAFALNMPVLTESFRIVRGSAKGWRRPSPSGVEVTSWFCADCGGRIYGERKGRPETINIRAGTLDDTAWLTPIAHIYLRSAQPWVQPWPVCGP